jgi:hypothetical protein
MMLFDIVKDKTFAALMLRHSEELISYLFEQEQNFGVLCKIEQISFTPPLPDSIQKELHAVTLFFLAGYTFESAHIQDDMLVFEAGFGSENFGSVVEVPLLSILQIIIDETPIFTNMATPTSPQHVVKERSIEDGIKNSMAVFLNDPANDRLIKK